MSLCLDVSRITNLPRGREHLIRSLNIDAKKSGRVPRRRAFLIPAVCVSILTAPHPIPEKVR